MGTSEQFSRRERQIMDILYKRREASVQEVLDTIEDPPSYSSIRALLNILLEKGHVEIRKEGKKYYYRTKSSPKAAGFSALKKVLSTFYEGSLSDAVAGFVNSRDSQLDDAELERLKEVIESAKRKEG